MPGVPVLPLALGAEELLQWGLVFLFFVLPVLRGIFETKKQQASGRDGSRGGSGGGRPPRPAPAERERSTTADTDDPWERLLRGELPFPVESEEAEPEPEPPPRPPAPEPRAEPAPRPATRPATRPGPSPTLEERLESGADRARARASAAGGGYETEAFEEIAAFETEPLVGSDVFSTGTPRGGSLSPVSGLTTEPLGSGVGSTSGMGSPWSTDAFAAPAAAPELTRPPDDWRRAVVLSEILASPLALREEPGGVSFRV